MLQSAEARALEVCSSSSRERSQQHLQPGYSVGGPSNTPRLAPGWTSSRNKPGPGRPPLAITIRRAAWPHRSRREKWVSLAMHVHHALASSVTLPNCMIRKDPLKLQLVTPEPDRSLQGQAIGPPRHEVNGRKLPIPAGWRARTCERSGRAGAAAGFSAVRRWHPRPPTRFLCRRAPFHDGLPWEIWADRSPGDLATAGSCALACGSSRPGSECPTGRRRQVSGGDPCRRRQSRLSPSGKSALRAIP